MDYTFVGKEGHTAGLLSVLQEFRWKFAKDREYPDFEVYGYYHPNLIIETAMNEIETLANRVRQLDEAGNEPTSISPG